MAYFTELNPDVKQFLCVAPKNLKSLKENGFL